LEEQRLNIAKEILAVARELVADKYDKEIGFTDEQFDIIRRESAKWFKQAARKVVNQRGPASLNADIETIHYDGNYVSTFHGTPLDDDEIDPRKISLKLKTDWNKVDLSRLKSIVLDVPKALKQWIGINPRDLNDRQYYLLHFIIRKEFEKNVGYDYEGDMDAVVRTKYGTFDAEIRGEVGYRYSKPYLKCEVYFGLDTYWYKGVAESILEDQDAMEMAVEYIKQQYKELRENLLQKANDSKKSKMLEDMAPGTYRSIRNYGGNNISAYDFIITGKGGTVSIGQTRNITNESRHWVEGEDYDIILKAKPARSGDFDDLFDDSRFSVGLSQGRSFSHEV
jgi:hypothetical protein